MWNLIRRIQRIATEGRLFFSGFAQSIAPIVVYLIQMTKPHITIHDIARELQVSASTVSRALKDHPRISKSTREAVQKLARKYNYQPNVVASSLRKGQSNTVGVIVPRINRNFFSSVISGMEEILAEAGFHLIICQTHESYENEIAALQTLVNARVSAIVISLSMETRRHSHLAEIDNRGIRLLFFDRIPGHMGAGSVRINDRLGAYMNVKHLLEQGYREIFHVAGAGHISIYRDRKLGYMDAMTEAGISVPENWILETPLVRAGGEEAYRRSKDIAGSPDAFFCAGDYAALGVLQAATKDGRNVPGDLAVTGFGNEPFTEFIQPTLTTVDQRGQKMGGQVARMVLEEESRDPRNPELAEITLDPELIIRNSSTQKR